jgi:hypothetical protein
MSNLGRLTVHCNGAANIKIKKNNGAASILQHQQSTLTDRSMTNHWEGVSGNGNRIISRWRPNYKRKGHLSPRSQAYFDHLPFFDPPSFSLPTTFKHV